MAFVVGAALGATVGRNVAAPALTVGMADGLGDGALNKGDSPHSLISPIRKA
jgi:hypothetical protein